MCPTYLHQPKFLMVLHANACHLTSWDFLNYENIIIQTFPNQIFYSKTFGQLNSEHSFSLTSWIFPGHLLKWCCNHVKLLEVIWAGTLKMWPIFTCCWAGRQVYLGMTVLTQHSSSESWDILVTVNVAILSYVVKYNK